MSEQDDFLKYARLLREEFLKRLNQKTSWRKNELREEYYQAERDAFARLYELERAK